MIVGSADVDVTRNKSLADEAKELSYNALSSANGKNTNYYGQLPPNNSSLKVDDTWFKQNSKGICIGIYRWTGNGWTQAKLDHEALTVGQLSAITADLGTVVAGSITGVTITSKDNAVDRLQTVMSNGGIVSDGYTEREFTNYEGMTPQLRRYDATATLTSGYLRLTTTDKKRLVGSVWKSVLPDGKTTRSLYYTEKGVSTQQSSLSAFDEKGSRFIDFFAGEEHGTIASETTDGYLGSGMKIFSGQQMLINAKKGLQIQSDSADGVSISSGHSRGRTQISSQDATMISGMKGVDIHTPQKFTMSTGGDWVSDHDRVFIKDSNGNTMLRLTRDNTSNFVASDYIPQRTYSSAANVYVTANGVLGKSTSASKYKLLIKDADSVIENAKNILNINPSQWYDKAECEAISDSITNDTLEKLSMDNKIRRHHGFIAEHFRDNDLNEVVVYDDITGEIDGIQYDRIVMYQNEVIKEHENEINNLKKELQEIKEMLKK